MAHTGFPIHIPEGSLKKKKGKKRNPVSFLKVSKEKQHVFHPKLLAPETHERTVLLSRDVPGHKQNKWMAPIRRLFPSKRPKVNSTATMKGTSATTLMWPATSAPSRSSQTRFHRGQCGSEHSFSPEGDGQEQDTLVLPPLSESNCPSLVFH